MFYYFLYNHNFNMGNDKVKSVKILGTNIKALRKSKNLTQEQLAENVGVTVKYISHLERCLSFPSAETLDRISNALEVPVYRLFFDEKSEDIPKDILKRELHKIIDELK